MDEWDMQDKREKQVASAMRDLVRPFVSPEMNTHLDELERQTEWDAVILLTVIEAKKTGLTAPSEALAVAAELAGTTKAALSA